MIAADVPSLASARAQPAAPLANNSLRRLAPVRQTDGPDGSHASTAPLHGSGAVPRQRSAVQADLPRPLPNGGGKRVRVG